MYVWNILYLFNYTFLLLRFFNTIFIVIFFIKPSRIFFSKKNFYFNIFFVLEICFLINIFYLCDARVTCLKKFLLFGFRIAPARHNFYLVIRQLVGMSSASSIVLTVKLITASVATICNVAN